MQKRIIEFVTRTSNIDEKHFRELMLQSDELLNDMGTILIGKQAVDHGIIDEVGGIKEALAKLYKLIEENKSQP